MDVVYNHAFGKEMFEYITPQYFTAADMSGVGNSIETAVPMVRRFVRDSLEFWLEEYNLDGFRFDLMGIFDYGAMQEWGTYLNNRFPDRKILLYGEPWAGYGSPETRIHQGNIGGMAGNGVGCFNGNYREAVKGDSDGTGRGYMFNSGSAQAIEKGLKGSVNDGMGDPEQSLNYVAAHDNLCLWDKIKHCGEDNDYGKRVARFGHAIVLTSQGMGFIHAGDEMLRSKLENGTYEDAKNSYKSPDAVNMIRWAWKVNNNDTYQYHKDLVNLIRSFQGYKKE
jgi:pullulanase